MMKSTKLMTSLLVGVLGVTLVAPSVLAAENAKSFSGTGTITYKESTKPVDPVDPEKPVDPVDPVDPVNPAEGSLRVDFISPLDFGTQDVTTTLGKYNAKEYEVTKKGEKFKRGNYVQVTDQRAIGDTDAPLGWNLKATLTKQFSNGNSILNGATLTYNNAFVSQMNSTGTGVVASTQVIPEQGQVLALNESKLMAKAEAGKGFGTYTVEYGRPANDSDNNNNIQEADKTSDKSIVLTVPTNTPMKTVAYEAEITWTMEELK